MRVEGGGHRMGRQGGVGTVWGRDAEIGEDGTAPDGAEEMAERRGRRNVPVGAYCIGRGTRQMRTRWECESGETSYRRFRGSETSKGWRGPSRSPECRARRTPR